MNMDITYDVIKAKFPNYSDKYDKYLYKCLNRDLDKHISIKFENKYFIKEKCLYKHLRDKNIKKLKILARLYQEKKKIYQIMDIYQWLVMT